MLTSRRYPLKYRLLVTERRKWLVILRLVFVTRSLSTTSKGSLLRERARSALQIIYSHADADFAIVLLFLVAISEYDQMLYEDETVTRMEESMTLFESIAGSRWFAESLIMLFLVRLFTLTDHCSSRNMLGAEQDRHLSR